MSNYADDIGRIDAMVSEIRAIRTRTCETKDPSNRRYHGLSLAVSGLNRAREDMRDEAGSSREIAASVEVDADDEPDDEERLRDDLAEALEEAPDAVRNEVLHTATAGLNFLNAYLPTDEEVQLVTSLAPTSAGTRHTAVLAITSRRLVFVGPAPQALAWSLEEITGLNHMMNMFQVTANESTVSFGLPEGAWATDFLERLRWEMTRAVIEGS
jgi:hypothetical protein